ncbi:glycoside hydrolase, partial [Aureobasidium melanogenum]
MLSLSTIRVFTSLTYFVCTVHSLHIHRHHKHEPGRRDATTIPLQSEPSPAAETEAAELTEIITSIEQGFSDLPQDVLEFLEAIDDRLHAQEALIASLMAVFATVSTAASQTTTLVIGNVTSTDVLVSSSTSIETSSLTTIETYSSLPDQVSASDLAATSSTPESRVTRTLTRTTYVPVPLTTFVQPTPTVNTTAFSAAAQETSSTSSIPVLPMPSVFSSSDSNKSSTSATTTSANFQATTPYSSVSIPISTNYVFETSLQNNVAVYYGQTPNTKTGDLMELCQSSNVDIVVLAFVTSFFTNEGFPSANFGPACQGSTAAQQLRAPGLQNCTDLAPEIVSCQQLGKPVLVSLGGYYSNVTFASDNEAMQLAQNVWDLFGAGTGLDASLRPFGSIVVDGFDLDNESKDPTSYTTFAHALRTLFASDTSKKYFLSSAPQCPRPDASIPVSTMALCDFVFVQFYNNPSCDLSSDGFATSFADWSDDLLAANNETKVFIGAGASASAGSGYVEGDALGHQISLARELYTTNLGGIMLWDGVQGSVNVDEYGNDYLFYAKESLE